MESSSQWVIPVMVIWSTLVDLLISTQQNANSCLKGIQFSTVNSVGLPTDSPQTCIALKKFCCAVTYTIKLTPFKGTA